MDFSVLLHGIESVLTLFLVGAVGYTLSKLGWFSAESTALLPKLVTLVALPPYMLYNITQSFTRKELLSLAYGTVVPFLSIAVCCAISLLLMRMFPVQTGRRGIVCSGFTASNCIFIGLPMSIALFGESSVPYVLLYYFANTTFFWSVGNYLMAADVRGREARLFSRETLKGVFSLPMLGFLLGLAMLVSGIPLPGFIANACRQLGSLTTPLVLIALGISLQRMRLSSIRLSRDLLLIMAGRFVISPLSVILLTFLFPMPDIMRKVFIIQASLPSMASISLLASYYGSDADFAAVAVASTTLVSLVTIPLFMLLI